MELITSALVVAQTHTSTVVKIVLNDYG